jgi:hypothetical protein
MNANETVVGAVVDAEFDEVLDFLREICVRFHLSGGDPSFNEREFLRWVVVESANLYIRLAIQPHSAEC